jgi:transposase
VTAPDDLRARLAQLAGDPLVKRCAALRPSSSQQAARRATLIALRATAQRIQHATEHARLLERELNQHVRALAPALLKETGIATICAAQILVSWSHPGRIHSAAAFAQLAGTAPIPASSGQIVRYRLNRGGDRALNRALHTIVVCRRQTHPPTRAYVARRLAEGKTMAEITRCLKRYLARNLYRQLQTMPT